MAWTLDSDRPIFLQIVERIQMDIISGRYAPGRKTSKRARPRRRGGCQSEHHAAGIYGA